LSDGAKLGGRALWIEWIGYAKSLVAKFTKAAWLLIVTTNFAFPIHADFAATAFIAVVAAHDA
jgi:hypothetical protein